MPTSALYVESLSNYNVAQISPLHDRLSWPSNRQEIATLDIELDGEPHPIWRTAGTYGQTEIDQPLYGSVAAISLRFTEELFGPDCHASVPLTDFPTPQYIDPRSIRFETVDRSLAKQHDTSLPETHTSDERWANIVLAISFTYGDPNIYDFCEGRKSISRKGPAPKGGRFTIDLHSSKPIFRITDACRYDTDAK